MKNKKPKIVTLCGSVRFKEYFDRVAHSLTLKGYIILMPNVWGLHNELHTTLLDTKKDLDKLHLRKIDLSDFVYVVNVNNYIGESTTNEIEYAKSKNKKIKYLEKIKEVIKNDKKEI